MPEFKIMISGEALRCLAEMAVAERRPLDLQAEVCVLRQLGCWTQDPVVCVHADLPTRETADATG